MILRILNQIITLAEQGNRIEALASMQALLCKLDKEEPILNIEEFLMVKKTSKFFDSLEFSPKEKEKLRQIVADNSWSPNDLLKPFLKAMKVGPAICLN